MEILRGLHKNVDSVKADLFQEMVPKSYEIIGISTETGFLASEIIAALEKKGQSIGLADSLIVATAIQTDLVLVTSNTRHFQRVIDVGFSLRLQNWRQT